MRPDERVLVEVEVGVRDEAGREQVRVRAARDRRGDHLPDDVLGERAAHATERPAVVNLGHGAMQGRHRCLFGGVVGVEARGSNRFDSVGDECLTGPSHAGNRVG